MNKISEYVCFLNEYLDIGVMLLNYYDNDFNEVEWVGIECYYGCYEIIGDYVCDIMEECNGILVFIEYYIDYDKLGCDMELNGEIFIFEVDYKFYVFSGC